MLRWKTLGLGSVAAALVAMFLTASSAQAEPYGGFNSCNTQATYIDYGPRYVQPSQTVAYVAQPAQVTYANTRSAYAQPVYTQQVYTQPVQYRTVYRGPAYGHGYGGYGAVAYSGVPVVRARAYYGGSRHGHRSYRRHYAPRSRVYVGGSHHRPYRSFARSRRGHHGRSWGFSIGGGHGGGGVSFRYGH